MLENAFSAREVSLQAELMRRTPKHLRLTAIETSVVGLLKDLKAHRLKEIAEVAGETRKGRVIAVLQGLIDVEVVKKVRHGVYALIDASDELDIPRAENSVPRASELRVLEMLVTPTLATELRERLGVTRQRVDQILKALEARGLVVRHRTAGEVGVFLYVRADVKFASALAKRAPRLSSAKTSLLSTLRPDRLVILADAVERLDVFAHVAQSNARQLERQGLLSLFRLGNQTYVLLTPLGLAHPQYRPGDAPETPAADVYEAFGAVRAAFLQILHVLGPLKTIDLTYAAPETILDGLTRSSGQFVQALEREELVAPLSEDGGHARYTLTDRGALAAALIGLAHPPPSAEDLRARIVERQARRREQLTANLVGRQGPLGAASEAQASALKVLRAEGAMTLAQLYARMEAPPTNPKSMHLMLRTLAKRGVITRLEPSNGTRAPLWRATPVEAGA